jgi:hypothetical protein
LLDAMTRMPIKALPLLGVSPMKLPLLDMAQMKESSAVNRQAAAAARPEKELDPKC